MTSPKITEHGRERTSVTVGRACVHVFADSDRGLWLLTSGTDSSFRAELPFCPEDEAGKCTFTTRDRTPCTRFHDYVDCGEHDRKTCHRWHRARVFALAANVADSIHRERSV